MHDQKTSITTQQFIETYSRVKEKTSSSYSGRHVGHYKAALKNDVISALHAAMISFPYQTGFSPNRWHHMVEVMLEKDPGHPKSHRLHIIALLESDYNQSQRILVARPMSHHMEDHKMLPDMQYGSRLGRECLSPVLNKVLTHDIIHQTKMCGAFLENNATGWYDRLVSTLVFLEWRRIGIPLPVILSLKFSWESVTHHIKTAYGFPAQTYNSTSEMPLFGPGQGSTTGPDIWGIIFNIIVKICQSET